MSNKQQTAINLAFEYFDSISSYISPHKAKEFNDKRAELKELEKQQIVDARQDGMNAQRKGYGVNNEQYYKDTYGE